MKININLNIEKSHFFVIVGALILLTGVIIVGADYTNFGHTSDDLELSSLNSIPSSAVDFSDGIDENLDVGGTLDVTGATTLGTLDVTGATTLGTLDVTGATTLGTLTASGRVKVGGTVAIVGANCNAANVRKITACKKTDSVSVVNFLWEGLCVCYHHNAKSHLSETNIYKWEPITMPTI